MSNYLTMQGKTVLITGATNGIGKEAAHQIAKTGATVVIAGRSQEKLDRTIAEIKASSGNNSIDGILADLSVLSGMRSLAEQFLARYQQLDVLLNNAGAIFTERQLTADGFERTFALNHLSYFVVTQMLLDLLKSSGSARIVNVSSQVHEGGHINFDDLHNAKSYNPLGVYSQSKLANVMFTFELAERLQETAVTVNALHPGVVRSGFGKNNKSIVGRVTGFVLSILQRFQGVDVAAGADTAVYLACSPDVEGISGAYWYKRQQTKTSPESLESDRWKRLWAISEEMTQQEGISV